MKPSAKMIYDALLRGEVLTPQKALLMFGCMSLSQRVGEINREVDRKVVSRRVKGEVYNEYFVPLSAPVPPVKPPSTIVRAHVRRFDREALAGVEIAETQGNLFS